MMRRNRPQRSALSPGLGRSTIVENLWRRRSLETVTPHEHCISLLKNKYYETHLKSLAWNPQLSQSMLFIHVPSTGWNWLCKHSEKCHGKCSSRDGVSRPALLSISIRKGDVNHWRWWWMSSSKRLLFDPVACLRFYPALTSPLAKPFHRSRTFISASHSQRSCARILEPKILTRLDTWAWVTAVFSHESCRTIFHLSGTY